MTTEEEKKAEAERKREELKKKRERMRIELQVIKETPPPLFKIQDYVGIVEKAKQTKKEIRDLEKL